MSDHLIILVMGVSGSGKSTIAEKLAGKLGLPFLEADDFHTDAAKAKMAAGTPLTDEDRWPWLDQLNAALKQHKATGAVLACSALRHVYRDRLFAGIPNHEIVYLKVDQDELEHRLKTRKGHYMPSSLLGSQLATLEEPIPDEHPLTIVEDTSPDATLDAVLKALEKIQ